MREELKTFRNGVHEPVDYTEAVVKEVIEMCCIEYVGYTDPACDWTVIRWRELYIKGPELCSKCGDCALIYTCHSLRISA